VDLAAVRFSNPFVRRYRFSLAQGLLVITAHERRHLWQAWRIRGAAERAVALLSRRAWTLREGGCRKMASAKFHLIAEQLAPDENLVGVDAMRPRDPRHGCTLSQRLFDDLPLLLECAVLSLGYGSPGFLTGVSSIAGVEVSISAPSGHHLYVSHEQGCPSDYCFVQTVMAVRLRGTWVS
jgi:hypothetical protein